MPWVRQRRARSDRRTGEVYWEWVRVWVDPPPKKKPKVSPPAKRPSGSGAAERRRREAEARRARDAAAARARAARRQAGVRAKTAAATAAANARRVGLARERAEARREAYEALRKRVAEMVRRTKLVRRPTPRPPDTSTGPVRPVRPVGRRPDPRALDRADEAREAAKKAAWQETVRRSYAEQRRRYVKAQTIAEAKAGDARSARNLEAALRGEAQKAAAGQANPADVAKLAELYVAHAEKVEAIYKRLVGRINEAIDKGNIKTARTLYFGDFQVVLRERTRLFGDGSDPRKEGAFVKFFKSYGGIERAQAEWWKRQMGAALQADKESLDEQIASARRHGNEERAGELLELRRVYEGSTGTVSWYDPFTGKTTQRKRTVQEELQHREAMKRVEMERLRAQMIAGRQRQDRLMRAEGLVRDSGDRMTTPEKREVGERMLRVAGGQPPDVKRAEDLTRFADQVLGDWERENPKPPVETRPGRGVIPARDAGALAAWELRRKGYEKLIYEWYGATPPEWWDRTFQAPGISHALAILQGGVSAIGAGGRVVLKGLTGESQIAGDAGDVDLVDVPRDIQLKFAPLKTVDSEDFTEAQKTAWHVWKKTPEGRAWYAKWSQGRREQSSAEDRDFLEGFYSSKDPGAALDALNRYGSEPFEDGVGNLLFQLLADPTNAIPLKFTTYLARGKYAAAMAGKSKWLGSTKLARFRDFSLVDEGSLRLRTEMGKLKEELKAKGLTVQEFTDEILEEVAGITGKSAAEKAIRDLIIRTGLSPRLVNETQIYNLVEDRLKDVARRSKPGYVSRADQLKKKLDERVAADRAGEQVRRQKHQERVAARKQAQGRRAAAGERARERLKETKRGEERLLAKSAAAAKKNPPAAAKKATGRPSSPAKPKPAPMHVPSHAERTVAAKLPESPTREDGRRARHGAEYYTLNAHGDWVPKSSRKIPGYTPELRAKALAGDTLARSQVAQIARRERNLMRLEAEDVSEGSKFTQTDFDLLERAGVAGDADAASRLLTDRETVRHMKRLIGKVKKDEAAGKARGVSRNRLAGFVGERRSTITSENDLDLDASPGRAFIGQDLLSASDESARGVNDTYEVLSGHSTRYYHGGLFDKVRSASWRKSVGEARFTQLIEKLDELDEFGIAGFRDGGQVLFELFHLLRRSGDTRKLRRLSQIVDGMLADDPNGSIWPWMWKVMEERAVLEWAWDAVMVEKGFLARAQDLGLHPELALAMIPNGYFAKRAPNRFRVSGALRGMVENTAFRRAPAGWVEGDVLKAITQVFVRGTAANASRVTLYAAERFGGFRKAFKLRNRMLDELTHSSLAAVSEDELVEMLLENPELLVGKALVNGQSIDVSLVEIAERTRRPLAAIVRRELRQKAGEFANGAPKRPEYGPLRAAVERLYWEGRLPVRQAEAHKLMLLAHLMDEPRSLLDELEQFGKYMDQIGESRQAERFVRDLFAERIGNLAVRSDVSPREAQVWGRFNVMPDPKRIKAWMAGRTKRLAAEQDIGTSTGAQSYRQLVRRYDSEEAMVRDLVGQHERDMASNAPVGISGTFDGDDFLEFVQNTLKVYRNTPDVKLRVKAYELATRQVLRVAHRLLFEGATGTELESLRSAVEELYKLPEAQDLVDAIRDAVGDEGVARWLSLTGGFPQYKRELKLTAKPARPGEISNETRARVAQKQKEIDDRPAAEIGSEFGDDIAPDITPADTLPISNAEALLKAISGMTEEQWWKYLSDKAHAVLQSPKASVQGKLAARKTLRDIAEARFAKKTARSRGTYIPLDERIRFQNRVLALHGKEAEELVAPKEFTFYAEDARGIAVEQSRELWRRLKSASSKVTPGVKTLGPKSDLDHMPYELYVRIDTEIARRREEIIGSRANLAVAGRSGGVRKRSSGPLHRVQDDDPRIIAMKRQVVAEFGASMDAWDEARTVARWPFVRAMEARWIVRDARRAGGDYRAAFNGIRKKAARSQARKLLGKLAWSEMHGASPDEVMAEFVRRHTDDGQQIQRFDPELTAFQRRTLEEHFKFLSGIEDIADDHLVSAWLLSRNAPPGLADGTGTRGGFRDFLVDIGAWSPRTAEQFTLGSKSWSTEDQARYWRHSYGVVPPWADDARLRVEFDDIWDDQELYFNQFREWGVFNKRMEAKARLSGATAEEIAAEVVKNKRELELQRRYVIDTFGDIVSDDGSTLKRMPWLMYEDELRDWFVRKIGQPITDGLVRSDDELDELLAIIDRKISRFWDKYLGERAVDGPLQYEDIYKLASEIQAELLLNPKWVRRSRDVAGGLLNVWATVNRALVFIHPAFMNANVIDVPIKLTWYKHQNRGLFQPSFAGEPDDVVARGLALTTAEVGLDVQTTLYGLKSRKAVTQLLHPVGDTTLERFVDRSLAVPKALYRFFPAGAAKAEIWGKMHLARGMYPQVYRQFLAEVGDAGLAHAAALRFIKKEISRMWPTAGDSALEQLFNRLVPFASYMFKNRTLFISEALAHPSILNQLEYIGRFVEEKNREDWERRHPGEPLSDMDARRIELPWAPGYFLDLGVFTDATRGLKPLYNATKPQSVIDFTAQFVRVVNPGMQAGIYAFTNAMGWTKRVQWKPILDENGFVTGYEKIITGWTEPWSDQQPSLASMAGLFEAVAEYQKLGGGGMTNGELSVFWSKVLMFDAVHQTDRGFGLYEFYKTMREKNEAVAERWLEHSESGRLLRDWLRSKMEKPRDVADDLSLQVKVDGDPRKWFHSQDPAFQKAVRDGYDRINAIRDAYEAKLAEMTPGTNEFRDTRAEMYLHISEVYRTTPELMKHEVYSKSAAEWAQELQVWQLDVLRDAFFALDRKRPQRATFKTAAAYYAALEAWRHQKQVMLKQHPQLEASIGGARDDFERVRDRMNAEWDAILNRIGERTKKIIAAKAAEEFTKADRLYFQNELDYSLLERDQVAMYFTEEDYLAMGGRNGRVQALREGALKTAKVLLDFDRVLFEKAKREGKAQEFLDKAFYGQGVAEVILKAKGGDPFGKFDPAKFVQELKRRPRLLAMYFDKNPGKKAQWKENDEYIRHIGKWGRAVGREDWDAAERAWSSLPLWVRQRYIDTHPDTKMGLAGPAGGGSAVFYNGQWFKSTSSRDRFVLGAAYMGYLKRWIAHFERNDVKGGMEFFWKMPNWVREKYFAKHPEKRAQWESQLMFGKQLAEYFGMDESGQAGYLKAHPDFKKWLLRNQSASEQRRFLIIAGYRAIPKDEAWLKRVYRERYPEVFSKEALGERKLKRVYDQLAAHPEMLPSFEKWVEAVWGTYAEMLKHVGKPPRWLEPDHSLQHRSRRRRSLSAEVVSAA